MHRLCDDAGDDGCEGMLVADELHGGRVQVRPVGEFGRNDLSRGWRTVSRRGLLRRLLGRGQRQLQAGPVRQRFLRSGGRGLQSVR